MPTRREVQLHREKMIQEVYDSQQRIEVYLVEIMKALQPQKVTKKITKKSSRKIPRFSSEK